MAPPLAYVDPTAGGIVVQIVLGGVAGALMVVKMYWARITRALLGRGEAAPPALETSEASEASEAPAPAPEEADVR